MIDSYSATSFIIGFLIIFGVVIPIFDKIPKVKDVISLRWLLVVVYSSLCIGVILDFGHLSNSVRLSVVIGSLVLSAIFLVVRSFEKAAVKNWKLPRTRAKVQKGDIHAEISMNPKLKDDLSNFILSKEHDEDYEEIMNNALFKGDLKQDEEKKK